MVGSWWSYDEIAEEYDRLAVPGLFGRVAGDLVALLEPPAPARILDVGAGSGVAALLALKSAGPGSFAVGLDLSVEMLRRARQNGLPDLVCGLAPGLPFRARTFDALLACFVLSHIPSWQEALADMVRVLRPGGRLGVTAWGEQRNEYRQLWKERAETAIGKDALEEGLREALPFEEWFSDPGHLHAACLDAGLSGVKVTKREYKTAMTIEEYLAHRDLSMSVRLGRKALGAAAWARVRDALSSAFHVCFREPLEETSVAYLGTGTRP
jgi:SAM-dependent methyltransferase